MSVRTTLFALLLPLTFCLGTLLGFGLGRRHATDPGKLADPHDLAAVLEARGLRLRYVPAGPDGTQGTAFLTETEKTREQLLGLSRAPSPSRDDAWAGTVHACRVGPWDEPGAGGERLGGLALWGDPNLRKKIKAALAR